MSSNSTAIILARNSVLNLGVALLNFGASFLAAVLLPRYLGPERFGEYSSLIWLIGIFSSLMVVGMPGAIRKFVAEFNGSLDNRSAYATVAFGTIFTMISGLILIAVSTQQRQLIASLVALPSQYHNAVPLLALGALPGAIAVMWSDAIAGLQNYRHLMVATAAKSFVYTAALLVSLYYLQDIAVFIFGFLVSQFVYAVVLALLLWLAMRKWGCRRPLALKAKSRLVNYAAIGTGIVILDMIVWQRSEIFFLSRYAGAEQIGYYSLAYSLTGIFVMAFGSLGGILTPFIAYQTGARNSGLRSLAFVSATKYLVMTAFPACFFLISISSYVVTLLFGSDFVPVAPILDVLLIGGAVSVMGITGSSLLYGTGTHRIILMVGMLAACVNIVLNLLLVPQNGAVGAALANTTSQCLAVFTGAVWVSRYHLVRYPIRLMIGVTFSSVVLFLVARLTILHVPTFVGLILAAVLSALVYITLLFALQLFTSQDKYFLFSCLQGMKNG